MSIRWVLLAGALSGVLFTGCSSTSDLGTTCTLVKKNPNEANDGIKSIPIMESEIVAGRDYISFGSTECEEFVCVRDASTPKSDATGPATGVCTRSCIVTDSSSCKTGKSEVDKGSNPYTCRALLLDPDTLAAIKASDPATYAQTFGDNLSPYFCAHPLPQQ
jgi:hypothetical protein